MNTAKSIGKHAVPGKGGVADGSFRGAVGGPTGHSETAQKIIAGRQSAGSLRPNVCNQLNQRTNVSAAQFLEQPLDQPRSRQEDPHMSLETKQTLEKKTIAKLQKLIRANIDSYNGFHESAEKLKDANLARLFRSIGDQRSAMATELQNFVEFNGEEAEEDGSVAAKTHRIWINIRGALNGGDAHVILSEAERGEDHIKAAYEEVLKETSGSAMNDVLQEQYRLVKKGHDQIRDLRDSTKK
jgi:uncharacterized protein (TIGR02284 family)